VVVALRRLPPASATLLALMCVTFALETLASGASHRDTLIGFGASFRPYFIDGQYWRLVMPMFLHLSLVHLVLNLLGLYLFGPLLERAYGCGRFALVFLGGGIAGSLASMLFSRQLGAGASGGILGVCAALVLIRYRRPAMLPAEAQAVCGFQLVAGIGLTLAFGWLVPGIDNWAHLGGLAGGAAVSALLKSPTPASDLAVRVDHSLLAALGVVCFSGIAALNYYPRWQHVLALEAEGNRLVAARQLDAARLEFERAKEIEPADSRPHESLAGLYVGERSWAEAIAEYRQDLRVATDRRRTLVALAAAYIGSGDATSAAQTIAEAVGHRQNAVDHEAVAELLEAHKVYAQAVQEHEVALRLHADWPLALNNLAWLYATSEDARFRMPLEAERLAQRAVDLTGWGESNYIDTLAQAHFARGDAMAAVATEREALRVSPERRDFQQHLAWFVGDRRH
jgi:membrane associated rhomboid family serine protease/Tfp pilus assembly protein PilF